MNNNPIIIIGNKSFCAFCGNEITTRDIAGTFQCCCKDAKEYRKALHLKMQLEIEASKVMAKAPKPKYGIQSIIAPLQESKPYPNNAQDDEPSVCW